MANSEDPDEMVCNELSHLDIHCLHKYWFRFAGLHHENIPTSVYNFDSLKPHFYIVKLGFKGVNIIFLISAQNTDCGYSLELP